MLLTVQDTSNRITPVINIEESKVGKARAGRKEQTLSSKVRAVSQHSILVEMPTNNRVSIRVASESIVPTGKK